MFFNESMLYLENEETSAPMSDEEMELAAEAGESLGEVQEGYEFYTTCLEAMSILDESYYNLREKMMNVEHIACLKESQGLYSESEMLMSEAFDNFFDKVKEFFEKLKNLIKNLFNKFVNFIMGLAVSTTEIKGVDIGDAWKSFTAGGKNKKIKVNLTNIDGDMIKDAVGVAEMLASDAEKAYDEGLKAFKDIKKMKLKAADVEKALERPKKIRDRYETKRSAVEGFLLAMTSNSKTVITKHEVLLTEALFKERVEFVIAYRTLVNEVKRVKDRHTKSLDAAIKKIREMENLNDAQTEVRGKIIQEYRWFGSLTSKCFSKLISLCSTYYRESKAVARRVMGTVKQKDSKEKWKDMTSYHSESFDMSAYFAD